MPAHPVSAAIAATTQGMRAARAFGAIPTFPPLSNHAFKQSTDGYSRAG
jgi:hypothetical protein